MLHTALFAGAPPQTACCLLPAACCLLPAACCLTRCHLCPALDPLPRRPTLDASTLLQQLQQGHLPSDSLPERDREVWRAASRITGTRGSPTTGRTAAQLACFTALCQPWGREPAQLTAPARSRRGSPCTPARLPTLLPCPSPDPISAFNICQAQQLAGRKLILTERGVAEALARGTIQVPRQPLRAALCPLPGALLCSLSCPLP